MMRCLSINTLTDVALGNVDTFGRNKIHSAMFLIGYSFVFSVNRLHMIISYDHLGLIQTAECSL